MSTTQLQYALVDVFAARPLEGNQLAIFTDPTGLTAAQTQALARETNLSETTFILPEDPTHEGIRVRIFTITEELPPPATPPSTLPPDLGLGRFGRGIESDSRFRWRQ